MDGSIEFEEDMAGIMDPIGSEFADRALLAWMSAHRICTGKREDHIGAYQVVCFGLGRTICTLIPPSHDPLVAIPTSTPMIQRISHGSTEALWVGSSDTCTPRVDRLIGRRGRA